MLIPVHPRLRAILDQVPARAGEAVETMTFLVTKAGKPFTPAGFTNRFRDCVQSAGLPAGCSPHGLRKAACRRLAEARCSPHQIMAITGHRNLKEVTRYTGMADRDRLAETAIETVAEAFGEIGK